MSDLLQTETPPASVETVPTETIENFKSFATEEEFNKFNQSTSSKAKNELLKEFNVENVADFKKQQKDVFDFKQSQKSEIEQISDEAVQFKNENTTLKNTVQSLTEEKTVMSKGINVKHISNVTVLARAKMNDSVNFTDAVDQVLLEMPMFIENTVDTGIPNTGVDTSSNKEDDYDKYFKDKHGI